MRVIIGGGGGVAFAAPPAGGGGAPAAEAPPAEEKKEEKEESEDEDMGQYSVQFLQTKEIQVSQENPSNIPDMEKQFLGNHHQHSVLEKLNTKCTKEKLLNLLNCQLEKLPSIAFLDSLLLGEWEDRMQRGLFRYDVTACETKVIPGEYGFIAQLNEGRHLKKRPTEFRVDKVLQPFDGNKFNFTKVGQEEVLFQFEASDEDNETQFFPNAPIDVENSPSVVAINVSPIEYGHVLLIPWILECLPQRIDRVSFLLALYMAAEAGNPYFRLGYNSLGAFATINHLHFQAYYLAVPFPIEKAPIREITTLNGGVKISELLNYPVRGLVFEGGNTLEDLSNAVSDSCICLQDNNVPYNVLISESGKRIYPFVIYPFSFSTFDRKTSYESEIEAMRPSESNTMFIDFSHVMRFNDVLQKAISDEYLRFEPYLKNACKRFVMEQKPTFITDDNPNKDINVAFFNLPLLKRLRDLNTADVGKLVAVSGVVTRTSEVRPELLQGTFKCLECGNVIKNVEQQFKYTEPIICVNATCNNKMRWALLRQDSKFADWQRVRVQEASKEIPAGSLPRSLDIILRHDIVEQARAGDTTVPDSDYWWFCFQEIMHDPQVAADGFTYEGDALRGWLENGRETSPMTNLRLDHLHLTPNHALRLAIQDWLCKV
ncbi:unnamed protein product [Camellia sinensis]